jgi:hypothetical protein
MKAYKIIIVSDHRPPEFKRKIKKQGYKFWKYGIVANREVELWKKRID